MLSKKQMMFFDLKDENKDLPFELKPTRLVQLEVNRKWEKKQLASIKRTNRQACQHIRLEHVDLQAIGLVLRPDDDDDMEDDMDII